MNTPVKCAKPTALGKKRNPTHGPTTHGKELFPPERTVNWLSGAEKNIMNMVLQFTYTCNFWQWKWDLNTENEKYLRKSQWHMPGFLLLHYVF